MCANVRQLRSTLKVHHSYSLLSLLKLHTLSCPQTQNLTTPPHFSSSNCDYLNQFVPFSIPNSNSLTHINSYERRKIVVGLSKMVKNEKGYILKAFSQKFCPYFLVKVMKLLETRETAFAFFKLVVCDDSESTIRSCCIAAHIFAAEDLRLLAQDVVTWVISRIGAGRSKHMVEFMCDDFHLFGSDFRVLDALLHGYLRVEMSAEVMEILYRMREVGIMPSESAITILFKSLLRVGDYGSVWKLFRDMIHLGPRPSNYTFNALILGFCRNGCIRIGESLLHVMHKYMCVADFFAYNILINAYCIRGRTSYALYWMHLMIERDRKSVV